MKIFEIIVETQNNHSDRMEINYFFDVLERLLDQVIEAEFLAGNNNVNINIPSSHPQDWKVYLDDLENTLKIVSACRSLSITKYPTHFDEPTIKKIDNMMTNCEIRIQDLPSPSLEENQQYMADAVAACTRLMSRIKADRKKYTQMIDENQQYIADNGQASAILGRSIQQSKKKSAKSMTLADFDGSQVRYNNYLEGRRSIIEYEKE